MNALETAPTDDTLTLRYWILHLLPWSGVAKDSNNLAEFLQVMTEVHGIKATPDGLDLLDADFDVEVLDKLIQSF